VRRTPLHHYPIGAARTNAALLEFPGNLHFAASDPGNGLSCLLYVVEGKLQLYLGGAQEILEKPPAGTAFSFSSDPAGVVTKGASPRQVIH